MKRKFVLMILVIITVIFTGCNNENKKERIILNTGWEYSLSDPLTTKADFSLLSKENLKTLQNLIPGGRGYIYLRNTFEISEGLKNKDLYCYLGKITMADVTYINNVYIGSEGRFPPNEFSAWNVTRSYVIPKEILNENKNVITIKIWSDDEACIISTPFIGMENDVKFVSNVQRFFNSKMYLLFAFFMFLISGYYFLIYVKRPVEKENLFFALINILTVFYMSVMYLEEVPGLPYRNMSFLIFQKIFSSGLPFLFPFLVTSFINTFLKRKDSKIILVARIICVLAPLILVFISPDYPHLRNLRGWTSFLFVPPMFYLLGILIVHFKRNSDTKVLLIGFSPLVPAVLLDIILHNLLALDLPYFTAIGWQLAVIALMFIMATRFTGALNEAEYLNHHLENEVQNRTSELSETNKLLSDTNNQLSEVNNKLSETNAELEEAKIKAERDMKLAVYVQNSFYQLNIPKVKGWDIALHFQPMAGVSGDLFDFFTEKDRLNGVGLFDVSGHGIASGLVTMLAKSVIDRVFKEKSGEKLSSVMKAINNGIIKDKGDIENYLTGVLFRINGNKVEYINAGHPKVFFRSKNNGKVSPVEIINQNKQMSGDSIIGIDGLDPEFKTIGFALNDGDSLIMYTDCLSESKSKLGIEFGTERIAKAFAKSGDGSAKDKMDNVLSSFRAFTNKAALNDDLTVIILQKTAD